MMLCKGRHSITLIFKKLNKDLDMPIVKRPWHGFAFYIFATPSSRKTPLFAFASRFSGEFYSKPGFERKKKYVLPSYASFKPIKSYICFISNTNVKTVYIKMTI